MADIKALNSLAPEAAETEFLKCCGSRRWARAMAAERPYSGVEQLVEAADRIWWSLKPADWLEAFHSHPRIGETKAAREVAEESRVWSTQEQAGLKQSAEETVRRLAELNRAYEEKFGYIFIVCATGKSADEMLSILQARIEDAPEVELRTAAAEQAKITELRLQKLLPTGSGHSPCAA